MKTTMPADTALYLADAMLAAISTDEILRGILTGVHLIRKGRALRATSTDRYRVHEVTLDAAVTSSKRDEAVVIPAEVLTWIARTLRIVAPRRGDRELTTVTIKTRRLEDTGMREVVSTIETGRVLVQYTTPEVVGHYPRLWELIEKAEAAEPHGGDVRLNTDFLGKLSKLRPTEHAAARFHFTQDANRPHVPAPVLATYEADGILARALVQPNISPR